VTDQRISVEVDRKGFIQGRRQANNSHSPSRRINLTELDADLIRLFERWLVLRDRQWREDEIRAFGSLLHRYLFESQVWSWIESAIHALAKGDRIRLELSFPGKPPYSRLAAIPWEYLYQPAREGRNGYFLATDARIVLSRYIPLEAGERAFATPEDLRMLVAVSQPDDRRLGPVMYDDVLAAITQWAQESGVAVSVLDKPTAARLQEAIAPPGGRGPDLVHFMGHGEFDPDHGEARLALVADDGSADWISDQRLADIFSRAGVAPRAVVLHSCEGGHADFSVSFAGLAPQLARSGVQCVVAMQYAVTNETAIAFSTSLYRHLTAGEDIDVAVQESRWDMSGLNAARDPRLLGIPVLYTQSRGSLFTPGRREHGDGDRR
jgi:CHAT domain-containing protein